MQIPRNNYFDQINITRYAPVYDTIHPSRGSSINPTLKVYEHNRAAHASVFLLEYASFTTTWLWWRSLST